MCRWMLEYGESAQFQRQACLLIYKMHAHRAARSGAGLASATSMQHVDGALFFAIASAIKRHCSDGPLQQVARAALFAVVQASSVATSERPVIAAAAAAAPSPHARASPSASPIGPCEPIAWPTSAASPGADDIVDLSRGAPGFKLDITSLFPAASSAVPFRWRFPTTEATAASAATAASSASSNPYCCANAVARFNAADRSLTSMIRWAQTTWLVFLLTVVGSAYAPSRGRLVALADPLEFKAGRGRAATDDSVPLESPLLPQPEMPQTERPADAQSEETASAYVALQAQTLLLSRLSRETAARASLQARVSTLEQALSKQASQLASMEQERVEMAAELEAATAARRKAQADLKAERALSVSLSEQVVALKAAAEGEKTRRERAVAESKALEAKRRAEARSEQGEKEQIRASVDQLTEQVQILRAWSVHFFCLLLPPVAHVRCRSG